MRGNCSGEDLRKRRYGNDIAVCGFAGSLAAFHSDAILCCLRQGGRGVCRCCAAGAGADVCPRTAVVSALLPLICQGSAAAGCACQVQCCGGGVVAYCLVGDACRIICSVT